MKVRFTASKLMGRVALRGDAYLTEFAVEDLPGWIAFYERMVEKYGKRTTSYQSALDALRSIS